MHSLLLAAAIAAAAPAANASTHVITGVVPGVRDGLDYAQVRTILPNEPRIVKKLIAENRQGRVQIEGRSPAIKEACETEKVWLSWNNAVPDAALVTCDCSCTSHDNSGWLVETGLDGDVSRVRRVALGKVSSVEELERYGERVPDTFSSHPWCSGAKPKAPTNAVFATLMKQPSQMGDTPYCFTPHFIIDDRSALLRMTPMAGEAVSDAPAAEAAMIAREVEFLRDWRLEFAPE
ncbi:Secreted protein [Stenotrophomonas maltophilia]